MFADFVACLIGGGVVGWCGERIYRDIQRRPRLYYNRRTGRWTRGWGQP